MKNLFFIIILLVLNSCEQKDIEDSNSSDKIVELISNNSISISPNDFTNFNTEILYNNDNISILKTSISDLEYNFIVQNDLISECSLVINSQIITYKFSYEFYLGTNSQKLNNIKVFNTNQLEKEYSVNFDGFREIIENTNDSNEFYAVIFDEFNRIRSIDTRNSRAIKYTYVNNNLSSIDINYEYRIDFGYDIKKNPFNLERFKNLSDVLIYINMLKGDESLLKNNYNIFSNDNNITSININDYPHNDFQNIAYEFQYNELEYPVKKIDSKNALIVKYIYE